MTPIPCASQASTASPPVLPDGSSVYIVDFSLSPEEITTLAKTSHKIVILDHHKTAIDKFKGFLCPDNVFLYFDENHSGAAITWHYFHGKDKHVPTIVQHVEDYDLWKHELPNSKAVHAYLRSIEMTPEVYRSHLEALLAPIPGPDMWNSILVEGRAIYRANRQQAKNLTDKPELVTLNPSNLLALAVNAPLHQDDIGEMLAGQSKSGVGAVWYWRDGKYKVSLRSRSVEGRPAMDVQAIAKCYGGSGHHSAASFSCEELPWRQEKTFAELCQVKK